MRIEALEVDDQILEKIEAKHGVDFDEVEEACLGGGLHIRRTRDDLYNVFSRTNAGRYLLTVLASTASPVVWRVVTARSMTQTEQRLYRRQVGG